MKEALREVKLGILLYINIVLHNFANKSRKLLFFFYYIQLLSRATMCRTCKKSLTNHCIHEFLNAKQLFNFKFNLQKKNLSIQLITI